MTERIDWPLVALAESPHGRLSPVQIQKAMFLFREGARGRIADDQFYDFVPYHYGPFSADIYYDLEALERRGLVEIIRSATGKRQGYLITPDGRTAAEAINHESHRFHAYVGNIARWIARKSFPELLRYVYRRWPQFRENSIFVDPR